MALIHHKCSIDDEIVNNCITKLSTIGMINSLDDVNDYLFDLNDWMRSAYMCPSVYVWRLYI